MIAIGHGILFGLLFIFSLGPAFFALIQTSLQNGFKPAMFLALGISISDIMYVSIALLGVSSVTENEQVNGYISAVGGAVLIIYGIYTIFKKVTIKRDEIAKVDESKLYKYVLKGFLLNGLNPLLLVFWVGIIGMISVNFDYSTQEKQYFFTSLLALVLSMDILKAYLATRLKTLISVKLFRRVNIIVGLIFFGFGIRLLIYFLKNIL